MSEVMSLHVPAHFILSNGKCRKHIMVIPLIYEFEICFSTHLCRVDSSVSVL